MSATRELIAALVAGGMDAAEAAGLVARAAVEMTSIVVRKTPGALRQQRYRERNKASPSVTPNTSSEASQNVTKRNEPSRCDAASLSLKEDRKIEVTKRESAKGSQLSPGWRPDPESWDDAVARLGSPDRAEYELKKFGDHALEKGRVAKNWNAAWRNWAKRTLEYGGRNGHAVGDYRTDPGSGRASTREAQLVAAVGRGAAVRLADRVAGGPGGPTQGDARPAVLFDVINGSKNAR